MPGAQSLKYAGLLFAMMLAALGATGGQAAVPASAAPVACDGQPYWCVEAINHSPQYVEVDVDGRAIGVVEPGASKAIPVRASSTEHSITVCKLQFGEKSPVLFGFNLEKICVANVKTRLDSKINLDIPAVQP